MSGAADRGDDAVLEGAVAPELAAEFPGLRLVYCEARVPEGKRSSAAVRDRLRLLADRQAGAQAVHLREREIPSAYRVFLRQVGVDPDRDPSPVERLMLERMREGSLRSEGPVSDALRIAVVETEVAMLALDRAAVDGELHLRLSGEGEKAALGESALDAGTIVLADRSRALVEPFGQPSVPEGCSHCLFVAVGVVGVPAPALSEGLWCARAALES